MHFFSKPLEANQTQEDHALEVNPVDTTFLKATFFEKKIRKVEERYSLWDQIQTYKVGNYSEKTLLIDPKVASTIADAIEQHSERGPDTKFIDADAGLCLVTKEIMQRDLFPSPKSYFIFEKDSTLEILNQRAIKNYLTKECKVCSVSLVKSVADFHNGCGDKKGKY